MRSGNHEELFGKHHEVPGCRFSIISNSVTKESCDHLQRLFQASASSESKQPEVKLDSVESTLAEMIAAAKAVGPIAISLQLSVIAPDAAVDDSAAAAAATGADDMSSISRHGSMSSLSSGSGFSVEASEITGSYDALLPPGHNHACGITQTLNASYQVSHIPNCVVCVVSNNQDDINNQSYFFSMNRRLFSGRVFYFYFDQASGCLYQCIAATAKTRSGLDKHTIVYNNSECLVANYFKVMADHGWLATQTEDEQFAAFLLQSVCEISVILSAPNEKALTMLGEAPPLKCLDESQPFARLDEGGGAAAEDVLTTRFREFLTAVDLTMADLEQINLHFIDAYFRIYQHEAYADISGNYREAFAYLTIVLGSGLSSLGDQQRRNLNPLFAVAAKIAATTFYNAIRVSPITQPYGIYQLLLAFANQYVVGPGAASAIGFNEARKEEVTRYAHRLDLRVGYSMLCQCWLNIWRTPRYLQVYKQTNVELACEPIDVQDILMTLRIVAVPFEFREELNQFVINKMKIWHMNDAVYRIQPDNQAGQHAFNRGDSSFVSDDGASDEGSLIELPLPNLLLAAMLEADLQQLTEWQGLIAENSLWFSLPNQTTIDERDIMLYKQQGADKVLLHSAQVCLLWPLFVGDVDQSVEGFYPTLQAAIGVESAGAAKVYWCYALIQVLLGRKNLIHVLPQGYEPQILQLAYDVLQTMLLSNDNEHMCLSIAECQARIPTADAVASFPFGGLVQLAPDASALWDAAISYDGDETGNVDFLTWAQSDAAQVVFRDFFQDRNFADGLPVIRMGEYVSFLKEAMRHANDILQRSIEPYHALKYILIQKSYQQFLHSFLRYYMCSLCVIDGLAYGSGERSNCHQKKLVAPYDAIIDDRVSGDRFGEKAKKNLACFIEFIEFCDRCCLFGERDAQHLNAFAKHLVIYLTPEHKGQADHAEALARRSHQKSWMQYQMQRLLAGAYRKLQLDGMRLVVVPEVGVGSPGRGPNSAARENCSRFFELLSGFDWQPAPCSVHGLWMRILPIYGGVVTLTQMLLLHTNAGSELPDNNQSISVEEFHLFVQRAYDQRVQATYEQDLLRSYDWATWTSDAAYALALVVCGAKVVQYSGKCSELCVKGWVQNTIAVAFIVVAGGLQIAGQVELALDQNNSNAPEHLIISNSLLFVMVAGAPIQLAEAFANITAVAVIFEFTPRLLFELGLAVGKCHSPQRAALVRRHMRYTVNRLLFAAGLVGTLSGASLLFPSFWANLLGTFVSLQVGQDITAAGIGGAFIVPGIVFLALFFKSDYCCKLRCKQPMDALYWLASLSMPTVLASVTASAALEIFFVICQHSMDPAMHANSFKNSTFADEKLLYQTLGIVIAILALILLATATSCRNRHLQPQLSSAGLRDPLRGLKKLCCFKTRQTDLALLDSDNDEGDVEDQQRAASMRQYRIASAVGQKGRSQRLQGRQEVQKHDAADSSKNGCSLRDCMPGWMVSCFGL